MNLALCSDKAGFTFTAHCIYVRVDVPLAAMTMAARRRKQIAPGKTGGFIVKGHPKERRLANESYVPADSYQLEFKYDSVLSNK